MATSASESQVKGGRKTGFLAESVAELKKVSRPTRQETVQATLVTLLLVFFFAAVLALLDWIFRTVLWQIT